ncbi:MAG: GNAT family protein [Armatimonadota bacterium]|jgi:RimJ/RimL family protein N-acetyltransferase
MIGCNLSGKKVNLRPLMDDDLPRRVQWMNDAETVRLYSGIYPIRVYLLADAERWRQALEVDRWAIVWAFETKEGRHIGDLDLHGIDRKELTAKLTVLLGDKEYWSQGYGTDAITTMLKYAFSDLCFDTITLKVFAFNKRAIACYKKCGFEKVPNTPSGLWSVIGPGEEQMAVTRKRFMEQASIPKAA